MKRALIGLVLAATCFSQHAEIYRLSDADATQGERLYDAMLNAEGDYKKWAHRMAYKVRDLEVDDKNHVSELGFSADFTTAVPSGGSVNTGQLITGGGITNGPSTTMSYGGTCYGYNGQTLVKVPCN